MEKLVKDIYIQCILNEDKKVIAQNDFCKSICGDMNERICKKGCQKHFPTVKDGESVFMNNRLVNDQYFNMSLFKKNNIEIINLFPVNKTHEVLSFDLLTSKEIEVAELMSKGYKNREIIDKLSISKSTLKTHINRIYNKLGSDSIKLRGRC